MLYIMHGCVFYYEYYYINITMHILTNIAMNAIIIRGWYLQCGSYASSCVLRSMFFCFGHFRIGLPTRKGLTQTEVHAWGCHGAACMRRQDTSELRWSKNSGSSDHTMAAEAVRYMQAMAGLSTDAMLMWGFSGRAGGAFSPDAFWCVQEEDEPNLPALSLLRLSMTSALPELQQPTPEIFFHLARLMQPRRKMHLFQQELMPASAIQPMFGTLYYSAPYTNQHHYTTGSIQAIGCFVCFWVHGFTGNRGQGRTRRRIRALSSSRMSLSPSETKLEGGGGR